MKNHHIEAFCSLSSVQPQRNFGHTLANNLQSALINYIAVLHKEVSAGEAFWERKASTCSCLLYSKREAKVGGGGQISSEELKRQSRPLNVNMQPSSTRSRVRAYGSNHFQRICVLCASILRTKLKVKYQASQGFADFHKENMYYGKSYYFHVFSQ